MSFSTSGNTASDTGTFDPAMHDNQIVAMYGTDAQARTARDTLVGQGVPASAIQVVARPANTSTTTASTDDDTGVWGAVRSLFVPDSERASFSHAVGHGHAMLVVTTTGSMDRQSIIHTLEGTNPIDFDAKLSEWKQSGYDYTTPHPDYLASTQATQGSTVAAGMGAMGVGMASTAAADAGYDTRTGTPATGTPMAATGSTAATARTGTMADTTVRDDGVIQVIDEQLRVAKREVAAGAVRVRSYIVERPVEEQVRLREEHVSIERHAVDRPADNATFQERVIEARATAEEAVVTKEARVVEEIGLRKEASERVETVRDTVRHTEVEIEDGTKVVPKTGLPPVR